jgi:hypothetical protein
MQRVPRSVVLVPNDRAEGEIISDVQSRLGLTVFDATTIEDSKAHSLEPQAQLLFRDPEGFQLRRREVLHLDHGHFEPMMTVMNVRFRDPAGLDDRR